LIAARNWLAQRYETGLADAAKAINKPLIHRE